MAEIVAVDATKIIAWSNYFKNKDKDKNSRSDPDAEEVVKGQREGAMWFGYQAHILVCATYGIPIMVIVKPAKAHESTQMLPLLRIGRNELDNFKPRFILADGAYDSKEIYRAIVEEFKAVPIIPLNPRRVTKQDGLARCPAGIPWVFQGYDKKQKALKYRCPLDCYEQGCLWSRRCSGSECVRVAKVPLREDYRKHIQVPRHTKQWKELYNMRTAVERAFAMSKGFRALENPHVRGIEKVRLHCLLSMIAMQAWALGMIKLGQPERIRSCVHGVSGCD